MPRYVYTGGLVSRQDSAQVSLPGVEAHATATGYQCARGARGPAFAVRRGRHIIEVPERSVAARVLDADPRFRQIPDAPSIPAIADLPNLGIP